MKPITLLQLRDILPGRPLTTPPPAPNDIRSVSTDSRHIEPGALFVAIAGDKHDGHAHIWEAAEKGAVAVLVERSATELPQPLPARCYVYQVASTRMALGRLAAYVRRSFSGKVVAVGGSNGKTSTKHLIDSVLSSRLKGSMSPKSFNNDIGVPLTIFAADPNQDYLVLEIGTNHHGELQPLSEMAQPDVAVVTSISAEHLEGLGDLAGVRKEEAAIIKGLKPGGLLVSCGEDADFLQLVSAYQGKTVTFGGSSACDLFATDVETTSDGTRFFLNGSRQEVALPQLGKHSATNALAAFAVARRFGLSDADITAALAHAHGPEMRLQLQTTPAGITILNDAYNANPASMAAALSTFFELKITGRRIGVLGDMRELGDKTDFYHLQLAKNLAAMAFDKLVLVGTASRMVYDELLHRGFAPEKLAHFENSTQAADAVCDLVKPNDAVLLKGSRGIALEKVAKQLMGACADAAARKVG